jgi:hypothetical protein
VSEGALGAGDPAAGAARKRARACAGAGACAARMPVCALGLPLCALGLGMPLPAVVERCPNVTLRFPCADMSWGVEAKLYNFVQWAIQKLEADTPELTDEDEEDNYQVSLVQADRPRLARDAAFARPPPAAARAASHGRNVLTSLARLQELVVWVRGFRNQLITVGAACSGEMKGAMANTLLSVWDLKNNQPGENLRAGGVAGECHAEHRQRCARLNKPAAQSDTLHRTRPRANTCWRACLLTRLPRTCARRECGSGAQGARRPAVGPAREVDAARAARGPAPREA